MGSTGQSIRKVHVIIYRYENGRVRFLFLKRAPSLGGFWQSVTGKIEKGEIVIKAALREAREETGIIPVEIFYTGYKFSFIKKGKKIWEYVIAMETDRKKIKLSREHSKYKWFDYESAVKIIPWVTSIIALEKVNEMVCREDKR